MAAKLISHESWKAKLSANLLNLRFLCFCIFISIQVISALWCYSFSSCCICSISWFESQKCMNKANHAEWPASGNVAVGVAQGRPTSQSRSTGRPPSASWSIAPGLPWIDKIPIKNTFNVYSRKYIKIIHGLVGHVYFWCLMRWLTMG